MNKQKVVVYVDDDQDDLEIFESLFAARPSAPRLVTFDNSDAAYQFLQSSQPNIEFCYLLIDVNLRTIDGFDFLQSIRKLILPFSLHIALTSTSRNKREITKSEENGVEFIPKPNSIQELEVIVDRIILHFESA